MQEEKRTKPVRWFQRLLQLLPFDFRWKFGAEMEEMFREQRDEARAEGDKMGILRLWWETLRGILATAPREHLDMLRQDAGYALRTMRKNPGFTLVAVLTLALGIGANTAIFSVINALLFRSLPVENPEHLVRILRISPWGDTMRDISFLDYQDLRDQNQSFSGLVAHAYISLNLTAGGEAERITGEIVTGNYFEVLGVPAALGRTFLPEEDRTPGSHPVAVLQHGFWQRQFGSDPGAIGTTISVNGHPFTIVGVAWPGFEGTYFDGPPDLWVPMAMHAQAAPGEIMNQRGTSFLEVFGRLKEEMTLEQGEAALQPLAHQLSEVSPGIAEENGLGLQAVRGLLPGSRKRVADLLALLMGVVGTVLVIACANVGGLLLARATGRTKEIAVRLALGATRHRLVRQLLTESLLLAAAGGGAGLFLSLWLIELLRYFERGSGLLVPTNASPDLRVLGFSLGISLLTAMLFGLAPAMQSSRTDVVPALKEGSGRTSAGRSRSHLRTGFVTVQVALALVLLVGAGLALRTLRNLVALDPGFDPENILLFSVDLGLGGYSPDAGKEFYRQLQERLEAGPGVQSASYARTVPLGGGRLRYGVTIPGHEPPNGRPSIAMHTNLVGTKYFETMRIPILRGRAIERGDEGQELVVAVINEAMAQRYWPGENPIGQRYRLGTDGAFVEVVGVAKDGKYRTLTEDPIPFMYLPVDPVYSDRVNFHVRTAGRPEGLVPFVQRAVQALDSGMPIYRVRTLSQNLRIPVARERTTASLLGLFGALALFLSMLGLYGLVSFLVQQRVHEIGIRMALGAQKVDVFRLILTQGMGVSLLGVGLGLVSSLWLTQFLAGFLFEVSPQDSVTLLGSAGVVAGVALLACYVPARRATKVDPMVALRYE